MSTAMNKKKKKKQANDLRGKLEMKKKTKQNIVKPSFFLLNAGFFERLVTIDAVTV